MDLAEEALTKACNELGKEFGSENVLPFQGNVTNKEQFVCEVGG